ncbi:FHA domain-containing protein [Agromyces salentinus]|uniref:FHA domain-containing protein n=1 Tax=Agromyces salentinus TaxID=269421 RepID=A0ABP4Z3G8_9MICO|nr:FHA domain-containing protein [Agromyces salentinus]
MATYTTDPGGTALAAVRGGAVLLVPADAADALTDVWEHLADPDPIRAVLDRLTVDGLSAAPAFALAVRVEDRNEVRIVVRGAFTARVDLEVVEGAGVSTWVERVVRGRTVILKATDAAAGDRRSLPIVEGVVAAASVTSTAVEAVAPSGPAVSEPSAGPASTSGPNPPVPSSAMPEPAPVEAPPAPPAVDDATVVSVSAIGRRDAAASEGAQPGRDGRGVEQTIIPPEESTGDHDGMTIVGADIRRLREERAARSSAPDEPTDEARALGIRMPDGTVEPISHEVVLGRAPSASQRAGGRLPRVVAIGAGDQDISRNHVHIAVEGDTVVVTDLHSRNGTHVAQPGKAPVRLRAGEPTPVLTGTVVDLGGGWTIQVVGI